MNNMENNYNNNEGFITTSFWDKSIHLMTIDEEGNSVDCYDKVVDDLKERENSVETCFRKEEKKNKLINFRFNACFNVLVVNIILTFLTVISYVVFVVCKRVDLIYSANSFVVSKLNKNIYAKMLRICSPLTGAVSGFIDAHGFANLFNYALVILSIISLISLIVFMISRDHVTVRWFSKLIKVKPLIKTKEESDRRVARLKSDLYNLQLRKHKVKFATHEK